MNPNMPAQCPVKYAVSSWFLAPGGTIHCGQPPTEVVNVGAAHKIPATISAGVEAWPGRLPPRAVSIGKNKPNKSQAPSVNAGRPRRNATILLP